MRVVGVILTGVFVWSVVLMFLSGAIGGGVAFIGLVIAIIVATRYFTSQIRRIYEGWEQTTKD